MAQNYDTMKNLTFLTRKLEELVIIKSVQNFSAKMLPYFHSEHYPFFNEFASSIMASDSSPTAEYREFSYPPQGRSTPPPTTSYLSARQESQAIAVDPSVVKPVPEKETEDAKEKEHRDKDKEKDDVDMSAPDLNPGYKPEERKNDKKDFKENKGGGGGGDGKLNGKLETAFMLPLDAKDSDEESESCTVNCLYYTMQCCECTIT